MADHDKTECLQVWQERMLSIDDVVTPEHDAGGARLFECAMQGETLQVVRVCDPREHNVRYACVDKIEMGQILNSDGSERAIP